MENRILFKKDAKLCLDISCFVTLVNLKIKETGKWSFDKLSAGRHLGHCHEAITCSELGFLRALELEVIRQDSHSRGVWKELVSLKLGCMCWTLRVVGKPTRFGNIGVVLFWCFALTSLTVRRHMVCSNVKFNE